MSCPAIAPVTFDLHEANLRLRFWLDSLVLDQADTAPVSPEQMAALLSELLRAGEWLRTGQAKTKDLERDEKVREYRGHLEQIRDLLPTIHRQLLLERARLEAERTRVEFAAAWAQGSRQTL
jgi:hypothetical protein